MIATGGERIGLARSVVARVISTLVDHLLRRTKISMGAAGFGLCYGAVAGFGFGTCIFPGVGSLFGGVLGGLAGSAAGFLAGLVNRWWAWPIAAILGGLWLGNLFAGGGEFALKTLFSLTPAVISGGLGIGVGLGLRRGASRLPGVQALSTIVGPEGSIGVRVKSSLPAEVSPSGPPPAIGNELTPGEPPE